MWPCFYFQECVFGRYQEGFRQESATGQSIARWFLQRCNSQMSGRNSIHCTGICIASSGLKCSYVVVMCWWKRFMFCCQASWRKVVSTAVLHGIPTPAFSTALAFYDGYRSEKVSANLIQVCKTRGVTLSSVHYVWADILIDMALPTNVCRLYLYCTSVLVCSRNYQYIFWCLHV